MGVQNDCQQSKRPRRLILDQLLGLMLVDELEAIARRDTVGTKQRLVDALRYGADVLRRFG